MKETQDQLWKLLCPKSEQRKF